jgi:hypothetical protein
LLSLLQPAPAQTFSDSVPRGLSAKRRNLPARTLGSEPGNDGPKRSPDDCFVSEAWGLAGLLYELSWDASQRLGLVQTRRLVSLSPADRRQGHKPTVRFSTGRRKDVHVGVVRRVSENVSAGLEEQRVTI